MNKKISELTEFVSGDVVDNDVLVIVDTTTGSTKKIKISSLKAVFLPDGVFYYGVDPSTATWRTIVVGGNLQVQFRIGATWYVKENYTPELS